MKHFIHSILILSMSLSVWGQDALIIDRVVGVVGDFHILQSDVEQQYLQVKMSGQYMPADARCQIFNSLVEQKLLMAQAKIDSIEVTPGQVELEMNSRLDYFISQLGSEEEMEAYFDKSIFDIKDDLRESIREQIMTQQVRGTITEDVSTTPSDVKSFFRSIPSDSLPYINTSVELSQIVAYPSYSEEAVFAVKERLLELRRRVQEGEDFGTLAILYSEGPSASRRGELGFMSRAELDKAYADAAWALKPGQVSKIVESSFGYHIIQMVERRGDRANTRHIILNPKADANAKQKAIHKLDGLRTAIADDSITFDLAAKRYSEDERTSVNGGLVVNPPDQCLHLRAGPAANQGLLCDPEHGGGRRVGSLRNHRPQQQDLLQDALPEKADRTPQGKPQAGLPFTAEHGPPAKKRGRGAGVVQGEKGIHLHPGRSVVPGMCAVPGAS
ncbi:MAG: peptidylprolyl isomerase [Bacteroidales bacterium]